MVFEYQTTHNTRSGCSMNIVEGDVYLSAHGKWIVNNYLNSLVRN